MYSFTNDYSEGAHPRILKAMLEANLTQNTGYSLDTHTSHAIELIKKEICCQEADIHIIVGGTQTNLITISAALRPFQAVISASTGHINVHETGAIEATGHKVLAMTAPDGRLTPALVQEALDFHTDEHMVQPKMVYISNSTEVGTQYTKAELEALSRLCRQKNLYLFMDGARMGAALTSPVNDLTLADIAALTDVFYIGGTKNGALFGEALVFAKPRPDFRWHMKRRGAMLAKGRLLGVQFQALLEDETYLEAARHANALALRLRDGVAALGYPLPVESPSNQQFPVLPNEAVTKLQDMGYEFEVDHAMDAGHTMIRLVASWATPEQAVEDFLRDLASCK